MPRSTPSTAQDADADAAYDEKNLDENERFATEEGGRANRGEKKKRAIQLERLGEALIKLKPHQLAKIPMPEDLAAAVTEAQRIWAKKAFGGFRRQVQFIGKIMRQVDAEPIFVALEALNEEGTLASADFQRAERWRTRLLDEGDAAVDAVCGELEAIDRTALRQLVRAALREKEKQATSPQTPSTNQKKLFRMLREAFEQKSGDARVAAAVNGSDDATGAAED
jgi:ribosome-associated protein